MSRALDNALTTLRRNEAELRERGLLHASVFGSVVRGEAVSGSDVDVLVELDSSGVLTLFQYADLRAFISDLLDGAAHVANRKTLKPLLRDEVLAEAVLAF